MAVHRKPKPRSLSGNTARTAATLALASAASATAFDGTGHAEPRLTPAQVKAKVDRLYHEAEIATEKYNGAKEKASKVQEDVGELQDEAARKAEALNSARRQLGSTATAQYRAGGIDPGLQLALSSDPDQYLERASLADRAGHRQATAIEGVQERLRELKQLRASADGKHDELRDVQADLKAHKESVTGKLAEAKRLLSRLTAEQQARIVEEGHHGSGSGEADRASRSMPRGSAKAPNARAAQAVSFAYGALGSPYVWGASGPNAFDCSGLTQAAYRSAGVALPRTTYTQINAGQRVSRSELAPGDLIFFYSGLSHVGLYVGNGQMIHAPNPSAPVRLAPIDQMPFAGATRVA
ncbi:NlpC/P60 family protein [Streptomyces sp. T-3]|nr:NlpC/P60 family protein [Streptomyces sp. T-3]